MALNPKKLSALLCFTAYLVDITCCERVRERHGRLSSPVNDSLPFIEFVVANERGETLAVGNASEADCSESFQEGEGGSFWVELDSALELVATGDNAGDLHAKCRLLSVTVRPRGGFSIGSTLTTMANQGDSVIHDIKLVTEIGGKMVELDAVDAVHKSHPFYGVLLAVVAAVLVGASFIFQKKALIKTEARKTKASSVQDGSCGEFAYLKQFVWWCGMLSMAVGEVLTFVAYSIAPAILITPLGALRVIVSAVLSSMFLGERLNSLGKIGVMLSLVGSVMIVIHAPRKEMVKTFEQVVIHFTDSTFLLYCFALIAVTVVLVVHVAPRHGRTNVMVHISICNIVGALCVLCGKGLGISMKEISQRGEEVYLHPVFWLLGLGNIAGIVIQIVYLNKALAAFDTSVITPIKYVFTNVFLIFGSILLFQEFAYMSMEDVIGITCGFATVVTGVVLLNLFKGRR